MPPATWIGASFSNPVTCSDAASNTTSVTASPAIPTLSEPTSPANTMTEKLYRADAYAKACYARIVGVTDRGQLTSIIEQNASVFKSHLGESNVLEHQSSFDWERHRNPEDPDDETSADFVKLKLASENWDIPIVATTNVQFFDGTVALGKGPHSPGRYSKDSYQKSSWPWMHSGRFRP